MMIVITTTHPGPKVRCQNAEPGEGYRLLEPYEMILSSDDTWSFRSGCWIRSIGLAKAGQLLHPDWKPRRRKLPTVQELYNELLFAVASKFPGETRHQTALRYIREREERIDGIVERLVGIGL